MNARELNGPSAAASLSPFAARVVAAYQRLPLNHRNRSPSYRSLEVGHRLPLAVMSKLARGTIASVDSDTLVKLANALRVSPDWLLNGDGDPPALDGSDKAPPCAAAPGLSPFAERVLSAYRNLPRGADGALPSFKAIEEAHGLPAGMFSKIRASRRHYPRPDTLAKLAEALAVSPEWLLTGDGAGPAGEPHGVLPLRRVSPPVAAGRLCDLPGWERALAGAVRLAPTLPAGLLAEAGECAVTAPGGAKMLPTPELVAALAGALSKGAS
ncbi:hypothetical protein WMF30_10910 [Sorangium sp. So ce134]